MQLLDLLKMNVAWKTFALTFSRPQLSPFVYFNHSHFCSYSNTYSDDYQIYGEAA